MSWFVNAVHQALYRVGLIMLKNLRNFKNFFFRRVSFPKQYAKLYFFISYIIVLSITITAHKMFFSYFYLMGFFYFGHGLFMTVDSPYLNKRLYIINFIFNFFMCGIIFFTMYFIILSADSSIGVEGAVLLKKTHFLFTGFLQCYFIYFIYLAVRILINWENIMDKVNYWLLFYKLRVFLFMFLVYFFLIPFFFSFMDESTGRDILEWIKMYYGILKWFHSLF